MIDPAAPTRTALDDLADAWYRSRTATVVGTVAVGGFQALLMGLFHVRMPSAMMTGPIALTVVSTAALLGRKRWPAAVLAIQLAIVWLAALAGIPANYFVVPAVMSLYLVAARSRPPVQIVGVLLTCLCLAGRDWASGRHSEHQAAILPLLMMVLAVTGVALLIRARRLDLAHAEAQARLGRQRDAARAQTRIASHLHDSVGHNLTAVIALCEGIDASTDPRQLDEALTLVNSLTRDSLDNTRRAVRLLHPDADSGGEEDQDESWDGLETVLDTVLRTGLLVTLTETGARPDDVATGSLVHTIVREALTNTMRHAQGATRAVVQLDHSPTATTITATDDGTPATASTTPGTGLRQLASTVADNGGNLHAGPTAHGWRLTATVQHPRTGP